MAKKQEGILKLRVTEGLSKDVGRAFALMVPEDPAKLQFSIGDVVEIVRKRKTFCGAMPAYKEMRGQSRILLDGLSRDNAGAGLDEVISAKKGMHSPADRVVLDPTTVSPADRDLQYIGSILDRLSVSKGKRIRASLFASRSADFKVESTVPPGPVLINPTTQLVIEKKREEETQAAALSYEDIGWLKCERPSLQRQLRTKAESMSFL